MDELSSLVAKTRSGDLLAFERIVQRFQDMAYGYAYSILGDFHQAEDAAQEAFIEAYRQLPSLREPKAFPGWFRRIVFKHCDRIIRRKRVGTISLDALTGMASRAPGPHRMVEQREMQEQVIEAIRALPEHQRTVTTLFYIDGYSQRDIAEFLEVPVTTVKKRLYDSRRRLKERMIQMVDETLKDYPLRNDFADIVVRLVASDEDLQRVVELMGGSYESVADAQAREMFVVGKEGHVESAGHLGVTTWPIGSTVLKAARSGAGITGESEGVPDPIFVQGYQAHFKLAVERGCSLVLVHGSQYDHAFCGFVPSFYYPVATLPCEIARSIMTRATVRKTRDEAEERVAQEALMKDPYATKISAFLGGGPWYIVQEEGATVGYLRVDPKAASAAREYGMPFGHVSHITVKTREAALAVIKLAGELTEKAGDTEVCVLQSHMTLITRTILSLGGRYLLRPSCDLAGLDAEMVAIVDLVALSQTLQGEFQMRLDGSPAHDLYGSFSIEMSGTTVGFVVDAGRVRIVARRQEVRRVLPRWVVTRLYVGYYAGEDVLAMGPIPSRRRANRRSAPPLPDDPDLDMVAFGLPENEAAIFRALFPKLWPCSMPDPDVWPWVVGKEHPRYQDEDAKTPEMKAQIDALRFPWFGY